MLIPVGKISGLYGIQGWVKIYSYTQPRDNIFRYQPWHLYQNQVQQCQPIYLRQGKIHGKGLIAQLEHYDSPEAVRPLLTAEIRIARQQLPELPADEYYWSDLQGFTVRTTTGQTLGILDHFLETAAQDVMVIHAPVADPVLPAPAKIHPPPKTHLIPFVQPQIVQAVDRAQRAILVHWDPDF